MWRADLARGGEELKELLCASELERAGHLHNKRTRRLWIGSRGVLRALLARYLGDDPRALRFALGAQGKPRLETLASTSCSTDLRFNLSHSGTLALYAVTAGRAIGIDVEAARRPIDEVAIAARVLGSDVARRLAGLDDRGRKREFLRAWVAHEAVVKCRGTGLATTRQRSLATGLWTAELDLGPQAAATVAVEGGQCELRRYVWRW